jgi:hypothetical protein
MWLCASARAGPKGPASANADTRRHRRSACRIGGGAFGAPEQEMEGGRAIAPNCAARFLDRAFHRALRLAFEFQPRILMGLGPGQRGDPLHEVKDAFGLPIFLRQAQFR